MLTTSPALSTDGAVQVIVRVEIERFVVAYAPALTRAWVKPAALPFEICGTVQPAGMVSVTWPPAATPPVGAVYVSVSVLFVEPAVAVVGAIEAVPDPSAA